MYKTWKLVLVVLAFTACTSKEESLSKEQEQSIDTLATFLTQAQRQARLYTSEYNIHKVVTYSDLVHLRGTVLSNPVHVTLPLGDRKIAIPIDVTVKAYIDFQHFNVSNVERKAESILVTLPDPQVVITASRIDHQATKQYISLTRSRFSEADITRIAHQGEASIQRHLHQMELLNNARQNAARILIPMLTRLGYKEENITLRFRKDFTATDFQNFLVKRNDETPLRP
ncbi:MAG: DUF4230 domain-containing protein [Bacteroidaceae bacterium]